MIDSHPATTLSPHLIACSRTSATTLYNGRPVCQSFISLCVGALFIFIIEVARFTSGTVSIP